MHKLSGMIQLCLIKKVKIGWILKCLCISVFVFVWQRRSPETIEPTEKVDCSLWAHLRLYHSTFTFLQWMVVNFKNMKVIFYKIVTDFHKTVMVKWKFISALWESSCWSIMKHYAFFTNGVVIAWLQFWLWWRWFLGHLVPKHPPFQPWQLFAIHWKCKNDCDEENVAPWSRLQRNVHSVTKIYLKK